MDEATPISAVFFGLLMYACVLMLPQQTHGQENFSVTVAAPVAIAGEVRDGDIVSYDASGELYRRSNLYADEAMFGVMVVDPILYMTDSNVPDGTYPVVSVGEVMVNVSTLGGGTIQAGDLVTTSRIEGYGQRADRDIVAYVLGFALEPMVVNDTIETITVEDVEVEFGRVRVALRIGPHVPGDLDADIASLVTASATQVQTESDASGASFDTFKAFRLVLGAIVALTAIFVALRRFGDTFAESVVSVGRNPLARTEIRSVLIWNAFLIFIISGVGLAIAAAIILVP